MVTGFDLVEWQLRVAAGQSLPAKQQDIHLSGHAFEARLYAEDPARDFAPSIGRLAAFRLPDATPSVRIDSGFVAGDTVSVHYDAMLAKLIVHGATREAALGTLRSALADCEIVGVASNLDLLYRIAAHPAFAADAVDTGFIARHADTLLAAQGAPPDDVLSAAALAVLTDEADVAVRQAAASADPYSPWHARDQWWLNMASDRVLEFHVNETIWPVTARRDGAAWRLTIGDRTLNAAARRGADGWLDMTLGDARSRVRVTRDGETLSVRDNGATFRFTLPDPIAHAEEEDESGGRLVAPLPGQVTQVLAEPGAAVMRGQVLVVLEAMKTVFRLTAPADAVVQQVSCQVGAMVQEGQMLVSFAEPDEPA
jgi:3-methylcrotonyl-CoA carboxylase alpha subunit